MVSFSSRISLLVFCLDDLSIGDRGVLKSLTTTVLESVCAFKSFSVCLMKLGVLALGGYRLIIIISFWCIAPFISMKWPSLSRLTNVSMKSTLSKYCYSCLFSGAINLVNLLDFHPKPVCLFLSIRWVSCKQQIVRSSFLIQFSKQCFLMVVVGEVESIDIQC
jgi:hypothetical protein